MYSRKGLLSIAQCDLSIYDTIEITKHNFQDANDQQRKKATHHDKNIHSWMYALYINNGLYFDVNYRCDSYKVFHL